MFEYAYNPLEGVYMCVRDCEKKIAVRSCGPHHLEKETSSRYDVTNDPFAANGRVSSVQGNGRDDDV